jgi:SAM-dependent methyltransferase
MDRREHWDEVYRTRADAQLSWYQERPEPSTTLIGGLLRRPRSAIDVGGGQSPLAGALLEMGIPRIAVLDISEAALERGRERLGEAASRVEWIAADVVADPPPALGPFELWHDRAVFHFLTEPEDRRRYVALAESTIVPGGHLLIATFAPTGPERCSGLPVQRYGPESLAEEFAHGFSVLSHAGHGHQTPWGKMQDFTVVLLQRKPR